MEKKQKIYLWVGLGVLALTTGGLILWKVRSKEDSEEDEITATDLDNVNYSDTIKAGGSTVGSDVSSIGIGRVKSIPNVSRPKVLSSLNRRPSTSVLKQAELDAWEVVSVGERIAPKGNGVYVLTFKNRKPSGYLKAGQAIVIETKSVHAEPFSGATNVEKVWIDANGQLAGVYVKIDEIHRKVGIERGGAGRGIVGSSSADRQIYTKFKNNEFLADNQFVILKQK